jgi:hypothetical protein
MKTFNKLLLFAMMSSVFEGKNPFPETKYKEINGKCKLPGCEGEMNYGGYCCPDHCRQHKEILKEENKKIQKEFRKRKRG